jgi:sec-independent protein translocase protein TatC
VKDDPASLSGHLLELRERILKSLGVLVLATLLSLWMVPYVIGRIRSDLLSGYSLVVLSPLEAVTVEIQVALLFGTALSLPAIAYQAWRFISPGLRKEEKRIILYTLLPSVALYVLGAAFAYLFVLPVSLGFLLESASNLATPMLSLGETVGFVATVTLLMGLLFEMPLAAAALARTGLIGHKTLSSKRGYAIVVIFIVAAAVTPDPSPVTQILVAVPMLLLYEGSILAARLAGGKK